MRAATAAAASWPPPLALPPALGLPCNIPLRPCAAPLVPVPRLTSPSFPCSNLRDVTTSMMPNQPRPQHARLSGVDVGEVIVQPRIEVAKIFSEPKLSKYRVRWGCALCWSRPGGWSWQLAGRSACTPRPAANPPCRPFHPLPAGSVHPGHGHHQGAAPHRPGELLPAGRHPWWVWC